MLNYTEMLNSKSKLAINAIYTAVRSMAALSIVEISSPPGGGKSTTIVSVCLSLMRTLSTSSKVIVVTQSHPQAVSLVEAVLRKFGENTHRIIGAAGSSKTWPRGVRDNPCFSEMKTGREGIAQLQDGPCVVIMNSKKASDLNTRYPAELYQLFNYGFIDESYQMRYGDFLFVCGLAERWITVGDPGQLKPVRTEEPYDLAFVHSGARPYLAVPYGLGEEGVAVQSVTLPVSWRLPRDTVEILQPSFYPRLAFEGAGLPERRQLILDSSQRGDIIDRVFDELATGKSLHLLTLPAPPPESQIDTELHRQAVEIVRRLFERNAHICDLDSSSASSRRVTPNDVLILTSKVEQAADLQAQMQQLQADLGISVAVVSTDESFPSSISSAVQFNHSQNLLQNMLNQSANDVEEVTVDTANRLQGLEAPFVIAIHPCSGRKILTDFDLEIGRLCVMLSRHRIGCVVLSRGNVRETIFSPYLSSDRALENDPAEDVHRGLVAHRQLFDELRDRNRIW